MLLNQIVKFVYFGIILSDKVFNWNCKCIDIHFTLVVYKLRVKSENSIHFVICFIVLETVNSSFLLFICVCIHRRIKESILKVTQRYLSLVKLHEDDIREHWTKIFMKMMNMTFESTWQKFVSIWHTRALD